MTKPEDDGVWVGRCLEGDSSAFEPLVARYQRVLFAVALRLTGDYRDAQDATQNAFVKAYQKLDRYDPSRKFFSWLYRIAVNECLNLRRGRKPHEPLSPALEARTEARDRVEAIEQHTRIQAALLQLSSEYRQVVVLRHFAELSYDEIAQTLGIPEKTVKSRLFSARERLAGLLQDERKTRTALEPS